MSDNATIDRALRGAIDPHSHPFPSPFPRRIDIQQAAEHYLDAGFRAFVAKSHHHSTAPDIALMRRHGLRNLGIDAIPAIALNNHVGGLNPHAVSLCLSMGGRVVWFPTISAPNHIQHAKSVGLKFPHSVIPLIDDTAITIWNANDELRDEVKEILALIASADAVLASGHLPAPWVISLFEAAKLEGVNRLVLSHPNFVIGATHADARKCVELGAVVEHSLCMYDEDSAFYQWELDVLLDWIHAIGPEQTQLGSDLGQAHNPLPLQSYRKICGRLLGAGISERDIRMMVAEVPARLLGL